MINLLVVFCAQYLIFAVIISAATFWLVLPRDKKVTYAQIGVLASLTAFALAVIAAALYFDPRPFTHPGITALIPHAADNGFPSDHTLLAAVIAFATLLYSRKVGIAMIVAMLLIGGARVVAYVHSPIDIIGSIGIAAVAVTIAFYVQKPISLWLSARKT